MEQVVAITQRVIGQNNPFASFNSVQTERQSASPINPSNGVYAPMENNDKFDISRLVIVTFESSFARASLAARSSFKISNGFNSLEPWGGTN